MFDFYSQLLNDLRIAAERQPAAPPAWPDIARQIHKADIEAGLQRTYSGHPLYAWATQLITRIQHWTLNAEVWSSKPARNHRRYPPLKPHSPTPGERMK